MSVDNPDDLLRRMLPNFMRAHDEMIAELQFLRARVEEHEDNSDERDQIRAERDSLRAELEMYRRDKEFGA